MFKLALRNLWAYKRRLLTSGFAVVLGVSFLCGSYIFTDTLKGLFADLFSSSVKGVDAVVRAEQGFDVSQESGPYDDGRSLLPLGLETKIAAVPGVAAVEPYYSGYAQLINKKGKLVRTGGAPTFGSLWADDSELSAYKILNGRPPTADNEVVIDRGLIKTTGYKVGDKVKVNTSGPITEFTIVGDATFGSSDSALGATSVFFSAERGTELMGKANQVQGFIVRGNEGVTERELARAIRTATGSDTSVSGAKLAVITGRAFEREQLSFVDTVFKFINYFFTAFAVIALFVSVFVIANSFSIVVAQRNREMAMLRAIGAGRRQIVTATFLEALMVGLIASAVGIVAGIGVAWLIRFALETFSGGDGSGLPSSGFKVLPRTIILGMSVGTLVTIASAVIPAIRASRVKPLAALQATALDRAAFSKPRLIFGGLFAVASMALLALGLSGTGGTGARNVGFSAGLFLIAAIFLGPLAARPIAGVLGRSWYGWVIAAFGALFGVLGSIGIAGRAVSSKNYATLIAIPLLLLIGWTLVKTGSSVGNVTGQIARENSVRNPTRTSATALALTIGTAVVCAILVLSQSLTGTFRGALETSVKSNFIVASGTDFGFPTEVGERLRKVPGIEASSGYRTVRMKFLDRPRTLGFVDPTGIGKVVDLGDLEGDIARLAEPNAIAVDRKSAADNNLKLGSVLKVQVANGNTADFNLVAIYDNAEGLGNLYYMAGFETGDKLAPSEVQNFIYVKTDGKNDKAFQGQADKAIADFPSAELKTKKQFADQQVGQFQQFLALVNALLALAIIIAILGIANTLRLSIFERIREIGLLRAVGQSRTQVRGMIRWEAIVVATFGTLLGMAIGTGFGAALVYVLGKDGTVKLNLPWVNILALALIASLVGLYAARKPAKDAARMNILQAIATD
jgi:putative ABC transport system permease protein